jgi:peptide deformylase
MALLKLVIYPAESLNKPSKKVVDFEHAKKLIPDMKETMVLEKGIGLAAPQIGENIRLIIIHKDADTSLEDHLAMINPKIFSFSKETEISKEGCLSLPGLEEEVERHKKIKVRYIDELGKEQKLKATGLFARVIQHEIDHLEGILLIDKLSKDK